MARNEHIQVSLRLRPLSKKETDEKDQSVWKVTGNSVCLKKKWFRTLAEQKKVSGIPKTYTYSHCFTEDDSNSIVYETIAKRVVHASLKGYNGTLFVYGQTGSGKTYTVMGPHGCTSQLTADSGLLFQALHDLFDTAEADASAQYFVSCSYLEIYNEQVFDLFTEDSEPLVVSENPHKGFCVKGLSEHVLSSFDEGVKWISVGERRRKYASTALNHNSSRSHTIFRLVVTSLREGSSTESILHFADLAGSERVSNLTSTKNRAAEGLITEGKHINTSLFYLCQVISKLSERASHVPYRNSNLTKILRPSLGGNSLTSIICAATPASSQIELTLSTLRFGGVAGTITNTVAANVRSNKNAELIAVYQRDVHRLKTELAEAQQGGKQKAEQAARVRQHLEEQVLTLKSMLYSQTQAWTKQPHSWNAPQSEMWCSSMGDLFVADPRQGSDSVSELEQQVRDKDSIIRSLEQEKAALQDSNNNLKNELKKALALCGELTAKQKKLKDTVQRQRSVIDVYEARLDLVECQKGLEQFADVYLEKLEGFFFQALDAVKNLRFRKKYEGKLSVLMNRVPVPQRSALCAHEENIWKGLGLPHLQMPEVCSAAEESDSPGSQQDTTILVTSLFEYEVSPSRQPSFFKSPFDYD